ncbi:TetR/AcrR family transcriptional regulator [Aeromonas cavernicola]|uniref:TetR family transcriptional regulator n=1 Tax=Aeromonas cavernicola TaxID=1006623 RepID=A0A2H9U6K9_9GAMM|nr:TetR/AcrR family transcriptional regulator [Aeromonas cavernicola]PJG59618.1 TetR family transcriptional regulator [Aeromonas cavernicola]
MRIAEFDRDKVLQRAMEAFRAKGYAKTTMQELVTATGLHPGSIYAAFGSKRGLLLAAVDYYITLKTQHRIALMSGPSPLAGLRRYLLEVVEEQSAATCLVNRTVMELDQDEDLRERLLSIYHGLEQDFHQALTAAAKVGEIPANANIATLSTTLLVGVLGLVSLTPCRRNPALLTAVVDQLLASLQISQ